MQKPTVLLCLAIEIFGISCSPSHEGVLQEAQELEMETAAVRSVIDTYTSALVAGDLDRAFQVLSDDTVLLEPNRAPIIGKPAVYAFASPLMAQVKISRFETSPEKTMVEGRLGWEWGNYVEVVEFPSGEEKEVNGKYSIALQKIENSWLIISMMSSSN